MANESGAFDLGSLSKDEQEAVAALAAEQPEDEQPKGHHARTAFLVIVEEDGRAWVNPDCNFDLNLDKFVTPYEVYGAVAFLAKEIQTDETVMKLDAHMTNKAQAAMARQRAEAEAASVRAALPSDLKRGPRR